MAAKLSGGGGAMVRYAGNAGGGGTGGGGGGSGGKVGDMSAKDMRAGLYKEFGVKNQKELLKSNSFQMANGRISMNSLKSKDLKSTEQVAGMYRKHVGIIKNDPVNAPGTKGVVNGINILKYDQPWKAFGLDPKTSTTADLKSAYRKLAIQHHPDHGGDAATSEKLNNMYKSLTYFSK